MDRVSTELIRALQWPEDLDLRDIAGKPLRRPSPYWIQKKVEEKLFSSGKWGRGKTGGVESRWKRIAPVVETQLILNLQLFGYNRAMVSWKTGPLRIDELLRKIQKFNFIERAHAALVQQSDGTMSPMFAIEFVYRNETDYRKKLDKLNAALTRYTFLSEFIGEPVFTNGDRSALRRIINSDGKIREKAATVLRELIADPLISLPGLASATGMSRSESKKYFYDLVYSGAVLIQPAIDSLALTDFTLSTISVSTLNMTKDEACRRLMNETSLGERILISKPYYRDLLSYVCWSSSYYDIIGLHEEIRNSSFSDRTFLAWQFRSIPIRSTRYPFLSGNKNKAVKEST